MCPFWRRRRQLVQMISSNEEMITTDNRNRSMSSKKEKLFIFHFLFRSDFIFFQVFGKRQKVVGWLAGWWLMTDPQSLYDYVENPAEESFFFGDDVTSLTFLPSPWFETSRWTVCLFVFISTLVPLIAHRTIDLANWDWGRGTKSSNQCWTNRALTC